MDKKENNSDLQDEKLSRVEEIKVYDGISLIKSWKIWGFIVLFVFLISIPFSEDSRNIIKPRPNIIKPRSRHFNTRLKREALEANPESESFSDSEEIERAKRELNSSVVLTLTSVMQIPFQNLTIKDGKKIGTGFCFEIIETLAKYFNFSYEIVEPKDNSFGSLKTIDGAEVWTGMIGLILEKKASIGIGTFTETYQRMEVVDFSEALYEDSVGILMKKPHQMDNAGALFQPFSNGVWFLIVVACVAMGPSFYILRKIQLRLFRGTEAYNKIRDYSLIDCVWFVFAGLVKQGINVRTTLDSGRIFFATWWLFTLLITSFYTANLTAFLTLPVYHSDETLPEMLAGSDHDKWLILNNSALEEEIYNVSSPDFDLLRESLSEGRGEFINNEDEAVNLILENDYIYLEETMSINTMVTKYFMEHQHQCDIVMADYTFHHKRYAFTYEKGFKYAKAFDQYIKTLKRVGLIKKWISQYLRQKVPCSKEALQASQSAESSNDRSLTVDDCLSVFMSYGSGICAGMILVILEKLYSRKNKTTHVSPKITVTTGSIRGYAPYIRANRTATIKTIYSGR